jgi:thioester reductase-like protein
MPRSEGLLLFTGFPGFLGARLLPQLLGAVPEWRAACLVQPRFAEAARHELTRLSATAPWLPDRVELVAGDLTSPGLGLGARTAARLRGELVAAFHLAAVYDLAVERELAHRVNVAGTRHLLALLEEAPRFERLHHVSTAYVSGLARGRFGEADLDVGQGFKNHYEESKFLSEVAVVESGVPASIYRPGVVVGDSQTGETAKFDGPYFVMQAMERLPSPGFFLRVGSGKGPANLVPSDYVIQAMARLAATASGPRATWHLTDPDPPTVHQTARLIATALGRRFVYLPVPLGMARLLLSPRPVQRWLGLPVQALDYFDPPCRYDASRSVEALAALGLRCPRFADYVSRLVRFYREQRHAVRRTAMV